MTDDELLKFIRQFHKENGRVPVISDLVKGYKRRKPGRRQGCTDEELLNFMRQFNKEYGRVPIMADFVNNSEYPTFKNYQDRFGSWNKALALAGLDIYVNRRKNKILLINQRN